MANMKELYSCLNELCAHAQALLEEAACLRAQLSAEVPAEEAPARSYTLAEVRTALAAKSTAGFRKEVKALLVAHGAERLTDLDPNEYTAVMAEAEVIGA